MNNEYKRLYEMYIYKNNDDLIEIVNSGNGYSNIAIQVAMDILKNERGQSEVIIENNSIHTQKNDTNSTTKNDIMVKILQMFGVFFLLVTVWPLGMYFLWKNKKFDMQFKMIETFCCLGVWLLLMGWGIHELDTQTGKKHEEPEIVSVSKETAVPEVNTKESVAIEASLVKIEAEYKGSTKAGTVLDDDNPGISVIGIYSNNTTMKLSNMEYGIEKPVSLEAGKTSIVTISYNNKEYDLKVKCTSKAKSKKKPKKKHRTGKSIVGISNKDIHHIDGNFTRNHVPNDITRKWYISTIAPTKNVKIEKYALSYYKWYFFDDEDIHCIVNFTNKTTTSISVIGNVIRVAIHDYIRGEEHDANILFGGRLLKEYYVYKDNGDIEKIK